MFVNITIDSHKTVLWPVRPGAIWVGWNEIPGIPDICPHNLQTKEWNLRHRSESGGSGHPQEDEWSPNYNTNKTPWTKATRGQKRPITRHLTAGFCAIWSVMQILIFNAYSLLNTAILKSVYQEEMCIVPWRGWDHAILAKQPHSRSNLMPFLAENRSESKGE